jgi:hypothetical protein
MADINSNFTVSLGNCGTSEKTFLPTFDDCIVIGCENTDKKVSLKFLKNKTRDNVEVRFFSDIKTNVYTKKSILQLNTTTCNDDKTVLLCIVNYLLSGDTSYNIITEIYNKNKSKMENLKTQTSLLIKKINSFFDSNSKLERWRDIFKVYADAYNSSLYSGSTQHKTTTASQLALPPITPSPPPLESTAAQVEPLLNTIDSMTPPQQQTDTTASQLAPLSDGPNLNCKDFVKFPENYQEMFLPNGVVVYYNRNPETGQVDLKKPKTIKPETTGHIYYCRNADNSINFDHVFKTCPVTTPPVGGNRKRYRTSRKYRKQQSRKKSTRHIRKRVRTYRRKSRKSRK